MKRFSKRKTVLGIGLVLAGAGLALAWWSGLLQWNAPSRRQFPVRGIDVSHHQPLIDWGRVHDDHVDFVYLKATEGGDYQDPLFYERWKEARLAGLQVGAYHFFSFCASPVIQADNFLAALPRDEPQLPPVIDLEFGGNCKKVPSAKELQNELTTFTRIIVLRLARPPIFYVTPQFVNYYMATSKIKLPKHRLWIRSLLHPPVSAPCGDWSLWQFTDRGRVSGIDGPVDLDVFCGSPRDFEAFQRIPPNAAAALPDMSVFQGSPGIPVPEFKPGN